MNETLVKIQHDLSFASEGLREALKNSTAIEALILLPLVKRVNDTINDVVALREARSADAAGLSRD